MQSPVNLEPWVCKKKKEKKTFGLLFFFFFLNCSLFQMDACCGQWPVGGRPGWLGRTCCRWLFAVLGWEQALIHSRLPPSLESHPPGPRTLPAAQPELASEGKQGNRLGPELRLITHFCCRYNFSYEKLKQEGVHFLTWLSALSVLSSLWLEYWMNTGTLRTWGVTAV